MYLRTFYGYILTVLLLMMIICAPACGSPASVDIKNITESKRQVLIIDLPRFDLADVSSYYPNLLQFTQSSSAGIVSAPLTEPVTIYKVYLAFNSNTQLKTNEEACRFFNVTENYNSHNVGKLFQTLTGFQVLDNNGVNLGLGSLRQLNSENVIKNIGLFGGLLHQNSLKTGAIGNCDADILNRCGAMLVMDQEGIVDFSSVGQETNINDPFFPYETRTDIEKVLSIYNDFRKKADVIVLTLGDLERVERYSPYLSETRRQFYRRQVLKNYDLLLGKLLREINLESTLVVIFCPVPPEKNNAGNTRLNPVLINGPGFGSGILFSTSTRKAGLVTCYDLSATILNFFKIKTDIINGRNLRSTPGKWETINQELNNLSRNYVLRWPLLTFYGYLLIGLILLAVFGLIFYSEFQWLFKLLGFAYLFLLTIPAVFLLESMLNPLSWVTIAGWTLGLGGFISFSAFFLAKGDYLRSLSVICFITLVMIMANGLQNGFLELKSFLGYSAVTGARFYGIGNEYMGFLIGAFTVLISADYELLGKYRDQFLWMMVCLLSVFLAHPGLGANIGGGITALAGLGITIYILAGRSMGVKEIAGLTAALVTLLLMIGLWEIYISGFFTTHFGQFLNLIKINGAGVVGDLISRKWDMNLRLIAYTPWAKVLIAILLIIPLLYKKPPTFVKRFLTKYPYIGRGFTGLAISSLIALVVNDSGIVAATTMFIFGGIMILLAVFKECVFQKGVE